MGCSLLAAPQVEVSVYQSILGDYNSRPIWEWSIVGLNQPRTVSVSLDGAAEISLDATARSYRAPQHLLAGSYTLSVTATFDTLFGVQASGSATAVVATVRALPAFTDTDDPDDPEYDPLCPGTAQWALCMHQLPKVWDALAEGVLGPLEDVVVAVIDTGYVIDDAEGDPHEDLDGSLLTGQGYDFMSTPELSLDGDGIDPVAEDAGDGIAVCPPPYGLPSNSWHGTAMGGIIAADTDNATDVAGLAWHWVPGVSARLRVLPVRVLGCGGGTSYDIAQGIRYAAGLDNDSGTVPKTPAKILNTSFGGEHYDAVMELAVADAAAAGAIPVAATANEDLPLFWPARSPHTIAVGAVGSDGSRASYSNYGDGLDVVAAGGNAIDGGDGVLTLSAAQSCPMTCTWETAAQDGTSFATPHVAAALALVAAVDPDITLNEARSMLADSAVDIGPAGWDEDFGYGNLDAFALLGSYPPRPMASLDPLSGLPSDDVLEIPVSVVPASALANSLVVEWRPGVADRASARARLANAVGATIDGDGPLSLVTLGGGQERAAIRAALQADADVAAVHYNLRYTHAGQR